jgi:YD repeat-containing protein
VRLQRDALGQLTQEELPPGLNRQLRYNSDGLLTEQSLHAGQQGLFATRYDYDRAGNLTSRHDSAFGKDTYLYDPMGRILKQTDPQGDGLDTRPEGPPEPANAGWPPCQGVEAK